MTRKLLSQRHPALYFLAVWYRRFIRYYQWYFTSSKFAIQMQKEKLPYTVKSHQSVMIRKLGDVDLKLQYNKVTNLGIAVKKLDGIVIKPGETFSFCRLVGLPTKGKGYLYGMELSYEEAKPGIGGGLCQIANLLHWLVLHSPLTVVEKHHHSFDPFPDDGRVVPFGSGATIFYNYIDFQFRNDTSHTFQINLWLTEEYLNGELQVDEELDYSYHVFERDHQFLKVGDEFFRKNEIWRNKISKFEVGRILQTELIAKNHARVKYVPEHYDEVVK